MKRKKNFRKRPKDTAVGLSVTVYNNNIEEALKRFKRKVKNSNVIQELREKEYFVKKSIIKREKILNNIGRVRNVVEGPDGYLYLGVEGKGIVKILPKK